MSTEGVARGLREQLQTALGPALTLERELGGAGMSRVFVARDARLGRHVVVKVLHPDLAAGLSAQRFEREIRLAARLQHPHIVPVHTAGEVVGLPYYTMPFVEGESLRARLAREGALPIPVPVRLVRELADALSYAHSLGVVHRDLKPENVLFSGGHAVVADFGVAKALTAATAGGSGGQPKEAAMRGAAMPDTATGLGIAVGTPAYMAPEQVVGDSALDHRADLYALGVIAYELLTGAHPFAGRTPPAMLAAHLVESPEPLAHCRADVPPALATLVMRLLAKGPEDRPQSAGDVLRALDDVAADTVPRAGAAAAGAATTSRQSGLARGRRAGALVALAGLLVAAGLFARERLQAASGAAGEGAGDEAAPVRLAVLPFENQAYDHYLRGLVLEQRARRGIGRAGIGEGMGEAIAAYTRAVALDPTFGLAWARLAATRVLDAHRSLDTRQLTLARAALDSAARLAPDLPETRLARGLLAGFEGVHARQVVAEYRAAHLARPSDLEVLALLGSALVAVPGGWRKGSPISPRPRRSTHAHRRCRRRRTSATRAVRTRQSAMQIG